MKPVCNVSKEIMHYLAIDRPVPNWEGQTWKFKCAYCDRVTITRGVMLYHLYKIHHIAVKGGN